MATIQQLANGKASVAIPPPVAAKTPSDSSREEMLREIERLKAENATLQEKKNRQVTLKVSQKGALSLYGLGRFPVTLYKRQWEVLLQIADQISEFIKDHSAELADKKD